jgi:hypothetical protein
MRRSELRLALTAGLGNALAFLSGLPFSYYVPLAVLAVGLGSYGGSLSLGRQRILGSVLGAVLLVVGYRGLAQVPMPLGLALTLALLRLLGSALGLQVGYKVGGIIVVMGWLVHGDQLGSWLGLRLAWTCLGVVLALLAVRLFWPSRTVRQAFADAGALLEGLQDLYGDLAARVDPAGAPPGEPLDGGRYRALRGRLLALRRQRPALAEELGVTPLRHPAYRLLQAIEQASSRLVNASGEMLRHPPPQGAAPVVERLHRAEADLLRCLAQRMGRWRQRLHESPGALPRAPGDPFPLPESWRHLEHELQDSGHAQLPLDRLERLAARLMLCRLAHQAMVETERRWAALSP